MLYYCNIFNNYSRPLSKFKRFQLVLVSEGGLMSSVLGWQYFVHTGCEAQGTCSFLIGSQCSRRVIDMYCTINRCNDITVISFAVLALKKTSKLNFTMHGLPRIPVRCRWLGSGSVGTRSSHVHTPLAALDTSEVFAAGSLHSPTHSSGFRTNQRRSGHSVSLQYWGTTRPMEACLTFFQVWILHSTSLSLESLDRWRMFRHSRAVCSLSPTSAGIGGGFRAQLATAMCHRS